MAGERSELEGRIGYRFSDSTLLHRALCHRSWIAESAETESNERLEFLGDAVLGWVIADLAYSRFSDLGEGALTDLRKSVVNAVALAGIARGVGLGKHLLLGRGEDSGGGRDRDSILSDAFEALLGAIYLDGGATAAFDAVERLVGPHLDASPERLGALDRKSALQERLAAAGRPTPTYSAIASGPDHDKWFEVEVRCGSEVLGAGSGRSKKVAEQAAAAVALAALDDLGD
ncbi:MAG: ribonuclease III [Actinomycetota bacterium]|jgi:ribonuclease-3|nr:ribonuclease III [Actinomycetota bacterium]MDA3014422.1 ribonuclease III [Actinomycetota bacterium]MDA3027820.1 ribonuclease III [Actinomycetota bacterium]